MDPSQQQQQQVPVTQKLGTMCSNVPAQQQQMPMVQNQMPVQQMPMPMVQNQMPVQQMPMVQNQIPVQNIQQMPMVQNQVPVQNVPQMPMVQSFGPSHRYVVHPSPAIIPSPFYNFPGSMIRPGYPLPRRTPLIQPKGYVPRATAPDLSGIPPADGMFRSSVNFVSPAVYHPGQPGKNISQNVLSVELASLSRDVSLATGDPVRCKQCQAIFCASDAPNATKVDGAESTREWTCKYCGCKQTIEIDDAEIPTSVVSEYVVAPAPAPAPAEASGEAKEATATTATATTADGDDSYAVFCVDVSGSMSSTSFVNGKHVSKLACVAEAVYAQIDALRHEHPNRRVCLVTFASDVDVFDGVSHKQPDRSFLGQWDTMASFAETVTVDKPISEVFDAMAEEVIYMTERGATALGPALLTSIKIASRKRGSHVVLCTDGMANIGIGSLDELMVGKEDCAKTEVELFYERLGDTAKDCGVTVSVIGIKGAECRMENIGVVADKSGGNVDLADPMNISFNGTIEEPILATNVNVIMRVEPAFIFENGVSTMEADVGNVKRLSQHQCALFSSLDEKMKPSKEVRMQCEIKFTKTNGAVHLRVVEKALPFLAEVREAVEGIDVQIVGAYVSRTAAKLAHDGEVEAAGALAQEYQEKLQQFIRGQRRVYAMQAPMMDRFVTQNAMSQCMVQNSLQQQMATGMSNSSAARNRNDVLSTNIYQMRSDAGAQQCLIM